MFTSTMIPKLIVFFSTIYGFDQNTALSIAKMESNMNQYAIGGAGEIGLFQILPSTVSRPERLYDLTTNIQTGVLRLKETQAKCHKKDNHQFVVCYNLGYYGAKKIKNFTAQTYFKTYAKHYEYYSGKSVFKRNEVKQLACNSKARPASFTIAKN